MRRFKRSALIFTVAAVTAALFTWKGMSMAGRNSLYAGTPVHAPDLSGADGWLNTDRPITMKELRGQVVLLDFWTYCCINCMHVMPDLKYLEEKYADQPFVVIGVHSGKFSQEKDAQNIRQAILRHDISHPVAVDSDYKIWNAFGVQAWPTLVLIDPEGRVVDELSGEGHRAELDKAIASLLEEGRQKGTLGKPLHFRRERESFKSGMLEFPGKVLVDVEHGRLFISDTNHHRVVVTDLNGRIQNVAGSGEAGLVDGSFATARFHQPQGLALSADGQTLYVADTENHAIRAVDLKDRTVSRIAGTGEQSYDYEANGPAATTALSSPWALARVGDVLYIAMAGTHQIWAMDLGSGRIEVYAGTGREARIDGRRRQAGFAQPSGVATNGQRLYVADSEDSSIRAIDLHSEVVSTVAGSGGLFDFGSRDGVGAEARFQHPLGVALHGNTLFVADTFNGLIRTIDLPTARVSTWLGGDDAGGLKTESQAVHLSEPGGLSIGGDTLYIADTNHHRILVVDIATKEVRPLEITKQP